MQIESLAEDIDELPMTFNPARTAVLAIHWQHGIAALDDPFGSVFGAAIARTGVVDRVAALLRSMRAAGSLVVHINICNPPEIIANNPVFQHAKQSGGLRCGSPEVQELEVLSDQADISLDHHRVSAFADTPLADILRERGIDTVVVTGVATNVAVEGTVRQAIDLGLYAVVLSDCCIAGSVERHRASIETMKVLATRVMTADEFLASLHVA